MEFWGVEVKSGKSLKVELEDDQIIYLSNACLGDVNKDKRGGPVSLYVKMEKEKDHQIGTLISATIPQISYNLVFEKGFELSHNWKYGSVVFTGIKMGAKKPKIEPKANGQTESSEEDDEDSDDEETPKKRVTESATLEKRVTESATPENGQTKISEDEEDDEDSDD